MHFLIEKKPIFIADIPLFRIGLNNLFRIEILQLAMKIIEDILFSYRLQANKPSLNTVQTVN